MKHSFNFTAQDSIDWLDNCHVETAIKIGRGEEANEVTVLSIESFCEEEFVKNTFPVTFYFRNYGDGMTGALREAVIFAAGIFKCHVPFIMQETVEQCLNTLAALDAVVTFEGRRLTIACKEANYEWEVSNWTIDTLKDAIHDLDEIR